MNQEVDGRPLILYAADYGHADVIEYLISAGADVNVNLCTISVLINCFNCYRFILVER